LPPPPNPPPPSPPPAAALPPPSDYAFAPDFSQCPYTWFPSITSASIQRFSLQWCRVAEGGPNTAVTSSAGSTRFTAGTRIWGSSVGGPDGSGGPLVYRSLPFSTGGWLCSLQCSFANDSPDTSQDLLRRASGCSCNSTCSR
jgi:hypothetical protein